MTQRRLEKQSAEMLHTNGSQPKSFNAPLKAKCQGNKQYSTEICAVARQVSVPAVFAPSII